MGAHSIRLIQLFLPKSEFKFLDISSSESSDAVEGHSCEQGPPAD